MIKLAYKSALVVLVVVLGAAGYRQAHAQSDDTTTDALPDNYSCILCHRKDGDLWTDSTPVADEKQLHRDVHWQKGIRCHDCHGGAATLESFKNHREDPTFRSLRSRKDSIALCGNCHSSIEYMRRFNPSARTDEVAEYWTSGHGHRLMASTEAEGSVEDKDVATCVSCHGRHGILAVKDPSAPVYPTNVGATCAHCHSDEKMMAGRSYNGRPLGHSQYDEWKSGIHGQAMLEKGDLSAPTCNDCHGNHGAMPPGVESVANACGSCHGKIAKLFAETSMRHAFERVGLPGCATCHGSHHTLQPSDEMLGMGDLTVCARCHNPVNPQYGATMAGGETARHLREQLDQLKREIVVAEEAVQQAERLGMEVRVQRFDLRQAFDALTNARTTIHSFAPEPAGGLLKTGLGVTSEVKDAAQAALDEHTYRRFWLAGSLLPILLVVGLLLLYIRSLPTPSTEAGS